MEKKLNKVLTDETATTCDQLKYYDNLQFGTLLKSVLALSMNLEIPQ